MTDPRSFELSGGELCLDFANTLEDRPLGLKENLAGWRDLLAFGEQASLVSKRQAAALRRVGEARPRAADRGFAGALALRECVYRVFQAVAAGRAPARADLASVNAALSAALPHARVEPKDGGFAWGWSDDEPTLERILWPIARSAAELLVSDARVDVRECASETCSWLFMDRSPRRVRRWCSMKTCGNRDKVRRFYERQRAAGR